MVAEHKPKLDNIPPLIHPDTKKYQTYNTGQQQEKKSRLGLLLFLLLLIAASAWGYFNQPIVLKFYTEKLEPTVTKLAIELGIKPPAPATTQQAEVASSPAEEQTPVEKTQAATTTPPVEAAQQATAAKTQQEQQPEQAAKQAAANAIEQEKIQQLQSGLAEHPENALQLASIYKAQLEKQPGDLAAKNGLSELRDWYRHQLADAMENNKLEQARQLVNQLQESFPGATEQPRFQELVKGLEQQEQVAQHLKAAKTYLEQNALTEPDGANALAEFQVVLALSPGNSQAFQGILDIADTAYSNALNLYKREKLKEAKQTIDAGLKAVPEHEKLKALQQKVDTRLARITRHEQLNKEAEAQYKAGNMIVPEGESAYDKYKLVLKENPNNLKARAGLQAIQKSLLDYAITLMDSGKPEQAKNILDATREKFGTSPILEETEFKLNNLIQESEPKVFNVVFSDKKSVSLNGMHNDKLKAYQTIYAGFRYKNFKNAGAEIQARLMDGYGRIEISSKTVRLPENEGEIIIPITIPTRKIANGSYKLELFLGARKLATGSFYNDNYLQ